MTTTVACNSLEDCEAVIQAVKATGQPETFTKLGRLERYADSLRPDPYAGASRVDRWGELSGGGGRRGGQAGLVSRIQPQDSHAASMRAEEGVAPGYASPASSASSDSTEPDPMLELEPEPEPLFEPEPEPEAVFEPEPAPQPAPAPAPAPAPQPHARAIGMAKVAARQMRPERTAEPPEPAPAPSGGGGLASRADAILDRTDALLAKERPVQRTGGSAGAASRLEQKMEQLRAERRAQRAARRAAGGA